MKRRKCVLELKLLGCTHTHQFQGDNFTIFTKFQYFDTTSAIFECIISHIHTVNTMKNNHNTYAPKDTKKHKHIHI